MKSYFNEKGFASSTYSTFFDNSIMCFAGSSGRKIILKENLRKLKLEVKIISDEDVLKKDMLDLGALNNFILTGKNDWTKGIIENFKN